MTDKAACEECLAELMLKAFTSLMTHAPSTAIDGALGIKAVRHRDMPRSPARHRPAARHGPLSELCGVRGAAKQFNPWARSDQARPLTLVSSSWRESSRQEYPAPERQEYDEDH